ncbi:MAG: hypothetical protein K0Q50_670 [Vampirovibrio sp.]|jgi:hypothetical protein|nr:hypothetical protein [Vampirovibrio sp.]
MSVSITLDAQDIAELLNSEETSPGGSLEDYLRHMMLVYEEGAEQGLFLPSLVCLSECFHCPAVDVYQTLESLREEGYDYYFMGFESPITLWYPARIA